MADGESEETARDTAEERTKPYDEKMFFSKYETLLNNYMFPLEDNVLHKKVLAYVKTLTAKGVNQTTAIKRSVRRYKK